jgi:hypothetical protein
MLGLLLVLCVVVSDGSLVARPTRPAATDSRADAVAIVDTAIARMGGSASLRAIHTVRYDLITQWFSMTFDARPFQDSPSYEMQTELRDYDARIWRNKRRFLSSTPPAEVTDLVVDTVAARQGAPMAPGVATPVGIVDGWAPLSIAYIDERREAFAFAPERLLLLLRDASDLRVAGDTVVGGIRHSAVAATIDGYPATVFFRRTDGFLAFVRYHADESNDFGLAPWGPMQVETWYSRWRYDAAARITVAQQWDVKRVGQPYKRITVVAASFNAALPRDSLVLSESVRAAYLSHARRPMADLPIDSAQIVGNGRIAVFKSFGAPLNALKLGDSWLLIEPGDLPLNAERAAAWLSAHDAGSRVIGGLVGGVTPMGGSSWLAREHMPVYTAPAGAYTTALSLRNYGAPPSAEHVVAHGQWVVGIGARRDSVWLEPIDLPNAPRTMILYVPSMRWAYSSRIAGPAELARVTALARTRGWKIDRIGSPGAPEGVPPST